MSDGKLIVVKRDNGAFAVYANAIETVPAVVAPDDMRKLIDNIERELPKRLWRCTAWTGENVTDDGPLRPHTWCGRPRCRNKIDLPTYADQRLVPQPKPDGHPRLVQPQKLLAADESVPLPNDWIYATIRAPQGVAEKFFCSWRCFRLYGAHYEEYRTDYLI